ncbi:unnamed protein product [Brassica oleracea]|uniref:(rape) hypothetical protein n=1 Tax=Brassica napus TaxID=3708 RepID=A0A816J0U2_BRANA|nr:unnamed protein product [Brassica napus]
MAAYEVRLFSVSLVSRSERSWRRRIFRTNFDDGIEEVFQRSTLDWLNQDDLVAIYDRHATIPLPKSLIALGPEPLEEGIFLYRARRFRDRFGWDDVEETRRKNCRSGPPVQGAQVTRTEATMERPEGDLFCRRNHHRGDNQFCVVHYLIRPAEDDGGADEDVVDEADEDGDVDEVDEDGGVDEAAEDGGVDEAAEDGGEEDSTSSSDSNDVDGDPDYDPELDESEKARMFILNSSTIQFILSATCESTLS